MRDAVRHGLELLGGRALGRERAREVLLAGGEDVDGEPPGRRTAGSVREARSKQTSSSTGSSESDATAFVVRPAGPSGPWQVTTVTPVGKWPRPAGSGRDRAPWEEDGQ